MIKFHLILILKMCIICSGHAFQPYLSLKQMCFMTLSIECNAGWSY